MVLIKKKPILYTPLPSLVTVLQPLTADTAHPPSSPGTIDQRREEALGVPVPPDASTDDEQMEILQSIFKGQYEGASGHVGQGKGKKAGTRLIAHKGANGVANGDKEVISGSALNGIVEEVVNGDKPAEEASHADADGDVEMNGTGGKSVPVSWRIWDRECWYIPETGEVFTDYE
jgi:hypothetical protein